MRSSSLPTRNFKFGSTDGLTADVTWNTDFAQVEDDETQVNLSRFSLFYPEKREFFLEGQGVFDFGGRQTRAFGGGGSSDTPIPFFSRSIGISGGSAVPILGGARLHGRAGAYQMGLMNIQTGTAPGVDVESTNFSAFRVKRDLFSRSNIGVMATHRNINADGTGSNSLYGMDGNFNPTDHLRITTYNMATSEPGSRRDITRRVHWSVPLRHRPDRRDRGTALSGRGLQSGNRFPPPAEPHQEQRLLPVRTAPPRHQGGPAVGVPGPAEQLPASRRRVGDPGVPVRGQRHLREQRSPLAVYASRMLEEVSGGRYSFVDPQETDEQWRVLDRDSNQPRTPASLSGGEQFLASLSLALGMVEMMARSGGHLKSLFFDEGFGSLDRRNLDAAIEALDKVASTGRMVAQRPCGQRNPVLPVRLHPLRRNTPNPPLKVHLLPQRAAHLAAPARRQHEELKSQHGRGIGPRPSHPLDSLAYFRIRERPVMPGPDAVLGERRPDGLPGRVVLPVALGDRPAHHRPDPRPHPPRRHPLLVPPLRSHPKSMIYRCLIRDPRN